MPHEPTMKKPRQQPWYARYHFRYDALRSSGQIVTYRTFFATLSEERGRQALEDLLGSGERYRIAFEGVSEIPMAMWPLHYRLACGLDKNGEPVATPAPKPAAPPVASQPRKSRAKS